MRNKKTAPTQDIKIGVFKGTKSISDFKAACENSMKKNFQISDAEAEEFL